MVCMGVGFFAPGEGMSARYADSEPGRANRWLYHLAKCAPGCHNAVRMEYAVPLGILVAFAAWIVATFTRLYHLHRMVGQAWERWSRVTRRRNECLAHFASIFSGYLPREDMRPRNLRRLTDDLSRTLEAHPDMPTRDDMRLLSHAEKSLRNVVVSAVQAMENSAIMREDIELNELSSRVSLSLFEQDELTRVFNRSVGNYNLALEAPGARMVAGMFGYTALDEIRW